MKQNHGFFVQSPNWLSFGNSKDLDMCSWYKCLNLVCQKIVLFFEI